MSTMGKDVWALILHEEGFLHGCGLKGGGGGGGGGGVGDEV